MRALAASSATAMASSSAPSASGKLGLAQGELCLGCREQPQSSLVGRRRVATLGFELHEALGQLRLGGLHLGPRSDGVVKAPGGFGACRASRGKHLAIDLRLGRRRACEPGRGLGVAPDRVERGAGRPRARRPDPPPPRRETVAFGRHDRVAGQLFGEPKRFDEPATAEQDASKELVEHGADTTGL